MKMWRALITVFVAGSIGSAAHAQYISQYSKWNDLSDVAKPIYAMGPIDGGDPNWFSYIDKYKSKEWLSRVDGITRCTSDNKLTGQLLARMIDNAYARDVKLWSEPPETVLWEEMDKLCRPWLDESRRKFGVND